MGAAPLEISGCTEKGMLGSAHMAQAAALRSACAQLTIQAPCLGRRDGQRIAR